MNVFLGSEIKGKCRIVFSYILYYTANTYVSLGIDIPIITFITNILCLVFIAVNYVSSTRKKIIAVAFTYLIIVGIETTVVLLSGFTYSSLYDHGQFDSILGLFCYRIAIYMVMLLFERFDGARRGITFPWIYWICIFMVPSFSILLIIQILQTKYISSRFIPFTLSMFLLVNFSVFYLYQALAKQMNAKIESKTLYLENMSYKRQYEMMKVSIQSVKSVRHDLVNHIGAIQALVKNQGYVDALQYMDKILNSLSSDNEYVKTDNIMVDGILNYKISEAAQDGIKVSAKITVPVSMDIEGYELTIILGNLLDNAFRAVKELNQKERKVNLELNYDRGRLFIMVSNVYRTALKLKSEHSVKYGFLTTKDDIANHGIGLQNVKVSVERYQGYMDIEDHDNVFEVFIMLYVKVK